PLHVPPGRFGCGVSVRFAVWTFDHPICRFSRCCWWWYLWLNRLRCWEWGGLGLSRDFSRSGGFLGRRLYDGWLRFGWCRWLSWDGFWRLAVDDGLGFAWAFALGSQDLL